MPSTTTTQSRPQQKNISILLIDAVEWSDAYPASPLQNVGEWFGRHLRDDPSVSMQIANAGTLPQPEILESFDGVILSGSPRDAWVADPMNESLGKLIFHSRDQQIPFLGVCFGHQLLAQVLGGSVARNPQGLEVGATTVELTAAGQNSPLFTGFPSTFEALESHQDAVLELPPHTELLAQGKHTPIQSFQSGPYLMGVQFHPEIDPDILRFIWEPRRHLWRDKVDFDLDQKLDTARPLPAVSQLLKNFATICMEQSK